MVVASRREKKRIETRARIMDAAKRLFLDKGYEASTIDEIAEHADISKRSFFDYFPSKEDVITSWQDSFGDLLVAKVAARPEGEALGVVVERAMSEAIVESANPESVAMDRMVRNAPSLRGHMHRKYAALEMRLAHALAQRIPDSDTPDGTLVGAPALLAMVAVGALRLGSQNWIAGPESSLEDYARQVFADLWRSLAAAASRRS